MAQEEGPWSESQWFPANENIPSNWNPPCDFYSDEENDRRWRIQNGTWTMNESIKEIDDERDAWLICNLILRRTEGRSPSADWYDEKDNSSYHITDAPFPPPKATYQKRSTNYYRGTEQSLVELLDVRNWMLDNTTRLIGYGAVLKMDFIYSSQDYTPQHVTLNAVQGKLDSRRFQVPKWRYIAAVADFCFELSKFKGDKIGSVDGKAIQDVAITAEGFLPPNYQKSYSPEIIHRGWATEGLEPALSELCFSLNDCAPENIILVDGLPVDGIPAGGDSLPAIGVVNWKTAGFVPKAWARTRFAVAMDCDLPIYHRLRKGKLSGIPVADAHNFRWGVWKLLGNDPYNMPEVNDLWWKAHAEYAAMMGPDFIQGRGTMPLSFDHCGGTDSDALL